MSKWPAIVGIVAVCAAARLWLMGSMEVIAKDGTTYVQMAGRLTAEPLRVVREYDHHVGYPAVMTAVHEILGRFWPGSELRSWEVSGQVVSLLAGVAATAALWVYAAAAFDRGTAFIAALLFGLSRKWAALGADVLSDSLGVCLQMWAVVFALMALGQLKLKSRLCLVLAACAGAWVGLGYLVRPEALAAAVLAGALWLGYAFHRRTSRRLALSAAVVAWAVTLACALPYIIAIGGLTKKKSVVRLVAQSAVQQQAAAAVPAAMAGHGQAIHELARQLSEAMHPLLATFACVWLIGYAVKRLGRLRWAGEVPSPRPGPTFMALGALAIMGPVLVKLYVSVGYISHRHVMFLAALLAPLAGAGVVLSAKLLARLWRRIIARTAPPRIVAATLTGAIAVGLAVHTLRPLHRGKGYLRQAGRRVAQLAGPDSYVLADDSLVLHYAQVPGECLHKELIQAGWFPEWVRQSQATHLVLAAPRIFEAHPGLSETLIPPLFVELDKSVAAPSGAVHIYRIERNANTSAGPVNEPATRAGMRACSWGAGGTRELCSACRGRPCADRDRT